jgi:ABC-type transport system involved in cytochrome bd biosynthesis fused ATPase/permease subunit
MPQKISDLMKQLLGAKRIALFLQTPDVEYLSEAVTSMDIATETQSLTIDGDVTWTSSTSSSSEASEDAMFTLRDLSLSFERGEMTLIAGKYGSGKSLLLLALLGEVNLLRGKISYALSPIFDPWQTEQQVDWSETLEGLAYAPQVSLIYVSYPMFKLMMTGPLAPKSQYPVSVSFEATAIDAKQR